MARYAGVGEQVKEITHRAMCGELDFNQSLKARVNLLKGHGSQLIQVNHIHLQDQPLQKVIDNLVYTEGVHFLCRVLKKLGYKLAVISGGFTPVAEHVKKVLNLVLTSLSLLTVTGLCICQHFNVQGWHYYR